MDKFTIIALIFIVLCLIPILYLLFFIGRIFLCVLQDKFAKEIEKEDPTFGPIKKKGNYDWKSVTEYFLDTKEKIVLSIESDNHGPTEDQRDLFIRIKDKYSSVYPEILKELTDYFDGTYSKEEVEKHLQPVGLYFLAEKDKWGISFILDIESEGDMGYDLDFTGLRIDGISAGD